MTLQLLLTSTNWVNLSIARRANKFHKQIPSLVMERRKMVVTVLAVSRSSQKFCFPEIICCLFTCLGTNEKFSTWKLKHVRLQGFNDVYTQRVKFMKEHDKWRDQYGKRVTPVNKKWKLVRM